MRIPVILVVPAHEHLRAIATEAVNNPAIRLNPAEVPPYPGFQLDASFAPVPLGSAQLGGLETTPQQSQYFAVRGHIETGDDAAPPERAGDAGVFSDPQIRPMLTCGGSPPVGNATTVASLLHVTQMQAKHLDGKQVAVAIVDTGINLQHLQQKIGHAPHFDGAASWMPPGSPPPAPGSWPVNHGTMCAFDVLIAAPHAILIDFPVLSAHYPGGDRSCPARSARRLPRMGLCWGAGRQDDCASITRLSPVIAGASSIQPGTSPLGIQADTATIRTTRLTFKSAQLGEPASMSSSRQAIVAHLAPMAAARDEQQARSWARVRCPTC